MLRRRKDKDGGESSPEATTVKPCGNEGASAKPVQERPRVCLIDVAEEITARLKNEGFNSYSGTLGPLVEVNNPAPRSARQCLPNFEFPPNLHEYDIVIIDLQQPTTVPYQEEDHVRTQAKGHRQLALVSSFPETIFDPRSLSASILESRLQPFMRKKSILLIFAASREHTEYHER
jgi:hypothetical protein